MARGYLGTTLLESYDDTPFEGFGRVEWALRYIADYGAIDGDHHRAWLLDQVLRILKGTPVKLSMAEWRRPAGVARSIEYRFETGEPSQAYLEWVAEVGEHDVGIPP